jgi:hydrogenase/urease accessory protein HupE
VRVLDHVLRNRRLRARGLQPRCGRYSRPRDGSRRTRSQLPQLVRQFLPLLACCLPSLPLRAHDPGLSTAKILLGTNQLEAVLVFAGLDAAQIADVESPLSKEKLAAAAIVLQEKAAQALEVRFDGLAADALEARCHFDESDNASVYVRFPLNSFSVLTIRSKWLALLSPGHRQFLSVQSNTGETLAERLLSANADSVRIEANAASDGARPQPENKGAGEPRTGSESAKPAGANSFSDFLAMGVRHIWTGYDHLLFLFGLLIVTRNFASSVKIITCFTIAHSITLAVATLNLVHISSRIVEPLIAVSIVYVGVENLLRGDDPKGRWLLTFAFGLIHGFGFASVLRELGVGANGSSIAVPLVSFNLGVELGQIVIAAAVLPVIWTLRARPVFVRRWVPTCSLLVALLGSYWFVQRVWF